MEQERWLPVVGYEGLYEVSNMGRVRSLDRLVPYRGGTPRLFRGRLKKVSLDRKDVRHVVTLTSADGKSGTVRVGPLVAAAFLGPCPPGEEVRHGPLGRLDDRASNLCYGTRAENMRDKIRDGTNVNQNTYKTCCPQCGGPFSTDKNGVRFCRPCRNAKATAWRRDNRERALEIGRKSDTKRRARRRAEKTGTTPLF